MNHTSPQRTTGNAAKQNGPLLRIDGLRVDYGAAPALSQVSLDVARGNITAIVGPSGCGKSTFLTCINRLTDLVPGCRVSGRIHLNGANVLDSGQDLLMLRRSVGMVFQKPNPFPLSICRNFVLPLKEHRVPRAQWDAVMESALRDVGLWDEVKGRLNESALHLSGGQQQRLCIARALALNPDVLLLDEPCSALDPIASGVVEDLIVGLKRRVSMIVVTHNLAQARRIADDVAVFWWRDGAGTVIEAGPAARLFSNPRDPDAAAYLNGSRG